MLEVSYGGGMLMCVHVASVELDRGQLSCDSDGLEGARTKMLPLRIRPCTGRVSERQAGAANEAAEKYSAVQDRSRWIARGRM